MCIRDSSEYVVAGTRFSVPIGDKLDVPISSYKENFKGTLSFIGLDKQTGKMNISFQILLPGVNFDLARAGKGKSHGWFFFSCCLLYTSPSPRDRTRFRMPSSA